MHYSEWCWNVCMVGNTGWLFQNSNMDPWGNQETVLENCNQQTEYFEDNFKPTVRETLPDSEVYLETLEKRLKKLKSDPNILKQLQAKREACMQQLMNGDACFDQDNTEFESPVNTSALLKIVAPERQALTVGEVVELVKYDPLDTTEDGDNQSDSASR